MFSQCTQLHYQLIILTGMYFYRHTDILFIFPFMFYHIYSVRLGSISDTAYIASNNTETYLNITCTQCTCKALTMSAIGWNCIRSNNTCQLFYNYLTADTGLTSFTNVTFMFQQSPNRSLSTISTVATVTSNIQMTTLGTCKDSI